MTEHDNNKPNQSENKQPPEAEELSDQDEDSSEGSEYIMLDLKLDDLNRALDVIERKNDDIHQKLTELLQSNREITEQLRNQNSVTNQNI